MANNKFIADLLRTLGEDINYDELKKLYKKGQFSELDVLRAISKPTDKKVNPIEALIKLETSGKGFSSEEKQIIKDVFPKSTIAKIDSKKKFDKELTKRYDQVLDSYIRRANKIERKIESASDRKLTVAFNVDMPDKEVFARMSRADKIAAIKKVNDAYKKLLDKDVREELIRQNIVAYYDPSEGYGSEEEIREALDNPYIARLLKLKSRSRKIRNAARNIFASNVFEQAERGNFAGPISHDSQSIDLSFKPSHNVQRMTKEQTAKTLANLTKQTVKQVSGKVVGKTIYKTGTRIKSKKKGRK